MPLLEPRVAPAAPSSRGSRWPRAIRGGLLALFFPLVSAFAKAEAPPLAEQAINLLREECFACHGSLRQKGGLRLDLETETRKGLESGAVLLHRNPEESELYRRITDTDSETRMPKEGDPLEPEQIEILRRWLEAGSPWFEDEPTVGGTSLRTIERLTAFEELVAPVRHFRIPILLALLLWLLGRRSQGRAGNYVAAHPEVLLLGAVLVGLALQHRETLQLVREKDGQLGSIKALRKSLRAEKAIRRPLHPPRLGGLYYRGNDERNEELYNGGFYRTCTMDLRLCQGDTVLAWGSPVDPGQPLEIQLTIRRSPFATAKLFSDRRLENALLTDREEALLGDDLLLGEEEVVTFTTVESGECWQLRFPIADAAGEGRLYLCPAKRLAEGITPGSPHYGIGYRLVSEDGKVSPESELWMGSIYHTGKVLLPAENEIQLNEWFDFRPIPEIEGGNTEDPKLLGVEDYE